MPSRASLLSAGLLVVAAAVLPACQASVGAAAAVGTSGEASADPGGPPDTDRDVAPGALVSLSCNHAKIRLAPGTYAGDLAVGGNHCTVVGAGVGKTIVEGGLTLAGNHNTVRELSVRGAGKIAGNHNVAKKVALGGGVQVGGNHCSYDP